MNKSKFGYKDIDMEDKADKVNDVFSSVSGRYDLMNDIMSFGLHRLWKKQFLRLCNLDNKNKILDIACGTGDISLGMMKHNPNIKLTCLDPNNEMIEICKKKLINNGFIDINYKISSIENYKSSPRTYDLITVAFGFRNFTDHEKSLTNIYNILQPGGQFLIMDFKKPRTKMYSYLFKFYTLKIIPKIGEKIANDYQSYRYLGESIQTYLTPDAIKNLCLDVGFDQVRIVNLPEDVATIHIAQKS